MGSTPRYAYPSCHHLPLLLQATHPHPLTHPDAEWKVDMDSPTDTHRHLSHLIGLCPGYAIASYNETLQVTAQNLRRAEVWAAAETSLIHRGDGTGPDADSGWEKVWRAACWAQLGNASQFYHVLSVSVLSLFSPRSLTPDADEGFSVVVRARA